MKAYQGHKISFIAPSTWLRDHAVQSCLLHKQNIATIPHGVSTSMFKKHDQRHARDMFHLPQDRTLILFGAGYSGTWKGFAQLCQALCALKDGADLSQVALVTFGAQQGEEEDVSHDIGCPIYHLGHIRDEKLLSLVYASCDVTVVPSLWESFHLVSLESMACGTPVVGYAVGGLPDMITSYSTGLLAEAGDVQGLTDALAYMVFHPQERRAMGEAAKVLVEQNYTLEQQAQRMFDLYHELCKDNGVR
jgi:glycosyltransferase involved in cell wall biosynthesis